MRKVVIFSVVAGFLSACAVALPVMDVATVANYLAQSYSEQRGTSNANVRVLTVDEAVASVDKVFATAPTGNFSSDRLARMKRLLRENLAFVYSYRLQRVRLQRTRRLLTIKRTILYNTNVQACVLVKFKLRAI